MTSQDARQGGLEGSTTTPDAKKLIEKAKTEKSIFVGHVLVDVGVEYPLPQWVTGAKLGKPTAKKSDGTYRVPIIWTNGSGTEQDFRQYGIGKRPDIAEKFIVVPYADSPTSHRLFYLTK